MELENEYTGDQVHTPMGDGTANQGFSVLDGSPICTSRLHPYLLLPALLSALGTNFKREQGLVRNIFQKTFFKGLHTVHYIASRSEDW
ncbi:hypothetical protein GDO81_009560 [Engystomops pustulosus]|uniref:Uncharacterized protein n=1 Tax=Engystomops pustulosus TaxID=76066 RepID=A0AAV7BSZ6_ENGPU|nr:hypothetical protein GDO81_009560 [Engystomops pustulosus]